MKISFTKKNVENEIESIWCTVAKIKKEIPFGENKSPKRGTKHFRGGAKVYVIDAYWGMCESVTVIGHHRSKGQYIKIDIRSKFLESFQLKVIYSPRCNPVN